mgnify:CR=1 FL=1
MGLHFWDYNIRLDFLGGAPGRTLASGITNVATSLTLSSGTGWPTGTPAKFVAVIERGTANEEKVLITTRSGTSCTGVLRGYDGTSAVAHSSGATIEHCLDAYTLEQLSAMANAPTSQYDLVMRGSTAASWSRIGVGSNGQALVVSGGVPGFGQVQTAGIADSAITSAKLDATIPLGEVGYASKTSHQTGITTAGADVTSMSVTFTAVAGRSYRVSAMQRVTQQSSAAIVTMRLHDGSGTQLAAWQQTLEAAEVGTAIILARFSPGAGSTTYKLNLITSAGTVDANASSTAPGFILVEDLGAA